jgi:hypothetical protein
MLTYEDCLGFCDLTEEEIEAISEHEHIPAIVALELGQYLVQSEDGVRKIKRMILDDIEAAKRENKLDRYLVLRATLKHFVDTHPENPDSAAVG